MRRAVRLGDMLGGHLELENEMTVCERQSSHQGGQRTITW